MTTQNGSFVPSPHDGNVVSFKPSYHIRYRISTWVIVAALVVLAAAAGFQSGPAGSQSGAIPQTAENPNAGAEFVYFPGQFLNQASEPSEHIQAF